MIPFFGTLQLAPLLLPFVLVVLTALVVGGVYSAFFALTASSALAAAATVTLGLLGVLGIELAVRGRESGRGPDWLVDLETLSRSTAIGIGSVGGDAWTLAQLVRLGVPTPETLVITNALAKRWTDGKKLGKHGLTLLEETPAAARREIEAFLHAMRGGKVVVRPSFSDDDETATYPGIFKAVGDVEPKQPHAVLDAVMEVLASIDRPVAVEYRRRRGAVRPLPRAVMLQRQLPASVSGLVQSRGLGGRMDQVLVDFSKGRSPPSAVSIDLVTGDVSVLAPRIELGSTPAWLARVAALSVGLDDALEGQVLASFAVVSGQLFIVEARRMKAEERSFWLSRGGPVVGQVERLPRFVADCFGGPAVVSTAASEGTAFVGPGIGASSKELRDEDGVIYVDFAVLRRALGRLAMGLLLREPIRRLPALLGPVGGLRLGTVPEVDASLDRSWRKFKAWQSRLAELGQDRAKVAIRRWLTSAALGWLSDGATGEPIPRVHDALRGMLRRRVARCDEELEAAQKRLETVEREVMDFAAALLARGAQGWTGMFIGDRHLSAGLADIDRWIGDELGRDALHAGWDEAKADFERRKPFATVARQHHPALGDEVAPVLESIAEVAPVAAGSARAAAYHPGQKGGMPAQMTVVLPDGRADFGQYLLRARAVVLGGGGSLSPMARLARELGLPAVLCIDRRAVAAIESKAVLEVDGTHGAVTV